MPLGSAISIRGGFVIFPTAHTTIIQELPALPRSILRAAVLHPCLVALTPSPPSPQPLHHTSQILARHFLQLLHAGAADAQTAPCAFPAHFRVIDAAGHAGDGGVDVARSLHAAVGLVALEVEERQWGDERAWVYGLGCLLSEDKSRGAGLGGSGDWNWSLGVAAYWGGDGAGAGFSTRVRVEDVGRGIGFSVWLRRYEFGEEGWIGSCSTCL